MNLMIGRTLIITFLMTFFSCIEEKTALEQLIIDEDKITTEQNELLFGLSLKMKKSDFYAFSLEKNQSGEFSDGGRYNQILVDIEDGFSAPVDFYFFQEFENKQLIAQENKFKFNAWAPWNEQYHADQLLPEVLTYLESHFGDDFIEITGTASLPHYVDIDANRRIDVYLKQLDDTYVYMDVTDLRQ